MGGSYFNPGEYAARLSAVRQVMARRGTDLLLLSAPENIFYLTGLDHWGYFAPHVVILPIEGEMVLVTRGMEKVTIANQVANARFEGHGDHESAADAVGRALAADPAAGIAPRPGPRDRAVRAASWRCSACCRMRNGSISRDWSTIFAS
jgi:Xaa-Pro dipeptidase